MQFDWMVQCYAGAGVHRDSPLLDSVDRDTVMTGVDAAVDTGLDGLWAPDHFMLGPNHQEFEVWTLLSALAERTHGTSTDIGPLVGSITYRNPALLAKMVTTVDHLSGGHARLGLGCGWHRGEHEAYDFDFPPVNERIDMLDEGLQVAKAMFTEREPDFSGEYYDIEDAFNEPKPLQDPYPPIVVGGAGPRMLRVAARHADEWNVEISARARGKPIEFKIGKFDEYLREEGRDPADVERSWLAHCLVREDEAELERLCDEIFPLPWGEEEDMDDELSGPAEAREKGDFLIGTPAEVVEQIESVREMGFEKLQLLFLDFPETRGMELFGDEVAPELQ